MVGVEGGTFTMGRVQDDVMYDWNTTPNNMHMYVHFYMDEAEVTNSEYLLFVQYTLKMCFLHRKNQNTNTYTTSVLPDTLVWRKGLGKYSIT